MCVYGSSFKVWFSFRTFGGSIFISGSCFVILAFTMRYSQIIVFVIRFIQGFVEVCLYGIYFFSIASKIPPIRLFIWVFSPNYTCFILSICMYLFFNCRACVSQQWVLLCRLGPRNLNEPELLDFHIQVNNLICKCNTSTLVLLTK